MHRTLILSLLSGLLVAQQPASKQPPKDPETTPQQEEIAKFITTLQQVVAPVLVFDRRHSYVNGLQPDQFRLFDNGKEQNLLSVDVTYTPISMVVAIQSNSRADKILPQVNKIGAMLKPIVLGDQGEAAVMAFDSRIRVLQPFTSDADQITKAVKSIQPGSTSSRLIDAVEESIRLLNHRDKNRRHILLVIGEGRDYGSEARVRETLQFLQLSNVTAYWVDMSHLLGTLTAAPPDIRPDTSPPDMHPLPAGVPATPTTVQQTYGTDGGRAEFLPLMLEIFHDVRNIFKTSPAELYTKGTGGNQFTFASQRSLETAISEIGDQLHSQYLLTYGPNNKEDGGFHRIQVEVIGHDYTCQTKPGYFMSTKFN
jgi:VWFA-related protein